MEPTTIAYLAGIIDGEGCIRIDKFCSKSSPIGYQYRSVVEITMCDRAPIEFLANATGRHIQIRKKLKSGRTPYVLTWRNGFAADLLRLILPYLHGKKEQAELCLHYEEHIAPGRGRTYTTECGAQCEDIRVRVSALKKVETTRC